MGYCRELSCLPPLGLMEVVVFGIAIRVLATTVSENGVDLPPNCREMRK